MKNLKLTGVTSLQANAFLTDEDKHEWRTIPIVPIIPIIPIVPIIPIIPIVPIVTNF
jgi:hypothetical protein